MRVRLLTFLAFAMGLLVFCGRVGAHHGPQGYDYSRRISLKGTVAKFVWANPHCQIFLDAKDDKGNVVRWGVELNNPGNLIQLGWTHVSLKDGDEVTLVFNPGKEGVLVGICADVFFSDGRKLHTTQGCVGTPQQAN